MNVLYATMQFGPGYWQGTERYVSMLGSGLMASGHRASVLAGDPEGLRPGGKLGDDIEPGSDGLRVLHCPSAGWASVLGSATAEQLDRLLEREQPDLVHVANPAHIGVGLIEACVALGIPVVATVMDYWWVCPKHTLLKHDDTICTGDVGWRDCVACIGRSDARPVVRAAASVPMVAGPVLASLMRRKALGRGLSGEEFERWRDRRSVLAAALGRTSAVIFPSSAAESRIGPIIGASRGVRIPYGLEPRWFDAMSGGQASMPTDPSELTIGYAGALMPHKGVHTIFEALHLLGWNRTRVRLAGDGDDGRYRRRLAKLANGLHVEFVGRVESGDMPGFLAGLDWLVVPSLWPENLTIVSLESQAVGTPVIASRVDGLTEAVDENACFEPGSAAELAACLERWVATGKKPSTPIEISSMGEMVERTIGLYEELVGAASACSRPRL